MILEEIMSHGWLCVPQSFLSSIPRLRGLGKKYAHGPMLLWEEMYEFRGPSIRNQDTSLGTRLFCCLVYGVEVLKRKHSHFTSTLASRKTRL